MNFYKIQILHAAPKDNITATHSFIFANSEEDIFNYIDEELTYGTWSDRTREDGNKNIYDDDYNVIGTENFKEKTLRLKGEIKDEDVDFSDAYYGITLYGWKLLEKDISKDSYKKFIELDLIKQV